MLDFLKDFSKTEKRIFWSVLAIALLVLFLLSPLGNDFLTDGFGPSQRGQIIGQIAYKNNDIRHKAKQESSWITAKLQQPVRGGDTVYSGKGSSAQVLMKSGSEVTMGENSLVKFEEIDAEKMANLQGGNFRLKIEGDLKIAIQGQVTQFTGKNSEVQVILTKNSKPKLKLIKGEASIKKKSGKEDLNTREIASLPMTVTSINDFVPNDVFKPEIPDVPVKHEVKLEIPKEFKSNSLITYHWKLYDIYEQRQEQLLEKKYLPTTVKTSAALSWVQNVEHAAFIDYSKYQNFTIKKAFETNTSKLQIDEVFVGENFWRVSLDGQYYSSVQTFRVETKLLDKGEPVILNVTENIPLVENVAKTQILLKSPLENNIGYVAQASLTENFQVEKTRTFWAPKPEVNLSFYRPGTFYYRFRAVSAQQELTRWSAPIKFNVYLPAPPPAPKLAQKPTPKPVVKEKVLPAKKMETIITKKEEIIERKPSAIDESSNTLKLTPPLENKAINEKYKATQLGLTGFMQTNYSSEQYYSGQSSRNASGMGVQGRYWGERSGFEGMVKSGIINIDGRISDKSTLNNFEGRYHYRYFANLPFNLMRELQISLFTGYEIYRNAGGSFSSQYDLIKFGTSLEFPISTHWMGGTEFVFGWAPDNTQRKEASGHLNYFLSDEWSLGLGYRTQFFDAGSMRAVPQGSSLPYREGSVEGFSVLNYHF